MNRYIGGGFLAALLILLGSGLGNVGRILPSFGSSERPAGRISSPVGTQPIEQAGRVVQRQSETTGIVPTNGFTQNRTFTQGTNVPSQSIPPVEIRPRTTPVTPDTLEAAPTRVGDIDPVQPDLIRPGTTDRPNVDEDLDSIPALW
jgi:hypothetical protein